MKGVLFLQGSLLGLNDRDGKPLFMEQAAGRPLMGILLEEAAAAGCFDQIVFVTSADACDDPVVEYLRDAWPAVKTLRLETESPFAFGPASRRSALLSSADYSGILSVEGFKAIAPRFVEDSSAVVFVLDVNGAPLCSRQYFQKAMPLAKEYGFCAGVGSSATSLCGFTMRALDRMSDYQRAIRVGDAAAARERAERAIAEARREKYFAPEEEMEAVHGWKRARAERYSLYRSGLLAHTLRDWVSRHGDTAAREAFLGETSGEAVSITTRSGVEMVDAAYASPGTDASVDAEEWLRQFEARAPHREGQRRFYPDYPSYLEVELTSRCNLACRFCPQTKLTRPKGDLEFAAFETLLDRVGEFVFMLNFSGFGEPTLHPRFLDFVRHAKACGIPRVGMETNGTCIDEVFFEGVFESGLDVLTVNLDALDEAGEAPFGSLYELVRRFLARRGDAERPFLVLQRVNMAVAEQDKKIQRDFALWHDVADAVVIRPFNSYRATFPDKRVIDFAPLERGACRKLLGSALVLSSGTAVMCEQCFDGQHVGEAEVLGASGENASLQALRVEQSQGRVGEFCAPCMQWYQQDASWTMPAAYHLWFEQALARAARAAVETLLAGDRRG